ncbi:DUF2231 domain-containing protein [Paenibacillus sp. CGMCC 1.16610]|nr:MULTISPECIES: DUF2231 domain-containing protein [Paenibacillus]MBA2937163.1 DUF2231 domain-containing protein [Paenibacillus sp. CGMCC 1.16610]
MFSEIFDHIHPILVHFPIAIISVALVFDLISAARTGSVSAKKGLLLWVIAALSAWLSVATGPEEMAYGNTAYLDKHSLLANFTSWMASIVVAWRMWMIWKERDNFVKTTLMIYLSLSLLTCIFVLSTGYFGGKMVYDDGVDVKVKGEYVNPPKSLK